MHRSLHFLTATLVVLLFLSFAAAALVLPDRAVSTVERRRLAQRPAFTAESFFSGDFGRDWEAYLADQFPLRQELRQLAGSFRTSLLGQRDSNGYYKAKDHLFQIDGALQETQIRWAAEKMVAVQEKYFSDGKVFWGVIPDKEYYADAGRPTLDYEGLFSLLRETLPASMTELPIASQLSLANYYTTDTHWRQETLAPLADAMLTSLGAPAPARTYTTHTLAPFRGVYYGQAALPFQPETLQYLTDAITETARVTSAEIEGDLPVYATERFDGMDGYDVFLHGAQAVVTLENPLATQERELILFRDSFGSSLAPLLLGGYSKITLVDLRYISSEILADYVDIAAGSDVLFLYSARLYNSGMLLK